MEIKPGTYKHFKGGEYEVLGIGRHSETLDELVFYRTLHSSKEFGENALWVRPISLFTDTVIYEGKETPRFIKYES